MARRRMEVPHAPQAPETPLPWRAALDRLYDAVGRERQLASALGAFRPFFGAQAASFFTLADPSRQGSLHTGAVGLRNELLLEYNAHYSEHDEWVKSALRRSDFGPGVVYRGQHDLMPLAELQQTYFGRSFFVHHEVIDVLSCVVETFASDGAMSWVTYFRHQGERPFTARDARGMALLAPHMRQVLRLHRRLAPQLALGATLRDILQQMETPVLFVAEDGRINDLNAAAQVALDQRLGWLAAHNGRLQVCEGGRFQDLSRRLTGLRQSPATSQSIELVNGNDGRASLEILPVQDALVDTIAFHPTVAICSLKPAPSDRAEALRRRFGITAAEARVAVRLAEGQSVDEISAELALAVSTVRSQLAAVRSKLGVRRQAQVVSAVWAV